MSLKCLRAGSTKPIFQHGNLILFSNRMCPYAQRVRLVLLAKDIPHEIVNIHLKDKPEWFKSLTPTAEVPVVEFQSGKILYESLILSEYFDNAYGSTDLKLQSKSPLDVAFDKILVERLSDITKPLAFVMFRPKEANIEEILKKLKKGLVFFSTELIKKNSTFFGGSKPMLVDYMLWPFFERLHSFSSLLQVKNHGFEINSELKYWMDAMMTDVTVSKTYLPTEIHLGYMKSIHDGTFNYDIGL